MIGIVDYGMGNLRSVQKAFETVGAQAVLLPQPQQLDRLTRLVLPGVGAFGDGVSQLRQRGWIEPVKSWIADGKPFLGVCLGMQLLFEGSQEDAASPDQLVPGLAVLPGAVERFPNQQDGQRVKVPHMGWNSLTWQRDDPLLRGLADGDQVYFVHSYYCRPRDDGQGLISAQSDYPPSRRFCASIWRGNLWATQFHPEKSQRVGLQMLRNFATTAAA